MTQVISRLSILGRFAPSTPIRRACFLRNLCTLGIVSVLWTSSPATAAGKNDPAARPASVDLALIEASPHELALIQVLAEICPPFLNRNQKKLFAQTYNAQLQLFMPKLDPKLAMAQLSSQRAYMAVVQDVRAWTLSYPVAENKALCIEFAENGF